MVYKTLPEDLPQILRKHGLKVVVVPGWRTRKTNTWSNGFDPVGVGCHHTATGRNWLLAAVLRLLTAGRPGLSGPLCNCGLGRDGTVYIIAAGRANHAGVARESGTVSAGDGNKMYIGIEAFNDGLGETWPAVQYNAYVLLAAVLSVEITKNSAETVRGHKEISTTGKIDPRFDMNTFRTNVAVKMKELKKPVATSTRGARVDHALKDLMKSKGKGERAKNIQAAIAVLKLIKPAEVNKVQD